MLASILLLARAWRLGHNIRIHIYQKHTKRDRNQQKRLISLFDCQIQEKQRHKNHQYIAPAEEGVEGAAPVAAAAPKAAPKAAAPKAAKPAVAGAPGSIAPAQRGKGSLLGEVFQGFHNIIHFVTSTKILQILSSGSPKPLQPPRSRQQKY